MWIQRTVSSCQDLALHDFFRQGEGAGQARLPDPEMTRVGCDLNPGRLATFERPGRPVISGSGRRVYPRSCGLKGTPSLQQALRTLHAYSQARDNQMEVELANQAECIWTIGHSTRSVEEFKDILLAHQIGAVVDVRSFPGSRRYPQFNKSELAGSLEAIGVLYTHNPKLGGRRRPDPNSKNTAWRNASFRAYADHIESEEFKHGVEGLLEVASRHRTAIMCAEALWWRCHRSLIADYLKSKGFVVIHIIDGKKTEAHRYTPAARILEGRLSYAGLLDG